MRRYRRRRSTQVWLPVYGNANDADSLDAVNGFEGAVAVVAAANLGQITVEGFPVTFDGTTSAWQAQYNQNPGTLHDIVAGQEWKLLRLVGKCHLAYAGLHKNGDPQLEHPPAAEVAAGFIVLKTDEEGNPLTDVDEVNPLAQEGAEDPWIWRRKWILGSSSYAPDNGTPKSAPPDGTIEQVTYDIAELLPWNNMQYGSVADGPHIDQKTRRRIGRQERLFFMLATRAWDPMKVLAGGTITLNSPGTVTYNLDLRMVGRLSSRMGNRNNASR